MNSVWTEPEKAFIREKAGVLTDAQIAIELTNLFGRPVTMQATRKQRQKMNIKKCHGRGICRLVNSSPHPPSPGLAETPPAGADITPNAIADNGAARPKAGGES